MALTDDERRALRTRLAPGGDAAADAVARAFEEGEELREVVVDGQGDVVAFTDRRALYVAVGGGDVQAVGYDDIEVRRRDHGLAIDALIEGGRLVLQVARGTFMRLAIVGTGAPPGRATWLPARQPVRREPPPRPEPSVLEPTVDNTVDHTVGHQPEHRLPPLPPSSTMPWSAAPEGAAPPPPVPPIEAQPPSPATQPGPPPVPPSPPPGLPPAGWNADPSGRHWWRWWDGRAWTDHVADGGSTFTDPLPPRS
jgi:hypothetical protein